MTRALFKLIGAIGAGLATVYVLMAAAIFLVVALALLALGALVGCVMVDDPPPPPDKVYTLSCPALPYAERDSAGVPIVYFTCGMEMEPTPASTAATPCLPGGTWTGTACEYDDPKPSEP